MKVSKLIEFDAASKAALGLEKNFGDSYLCRNNLIFRNIREQSLSLGFQFSAAPNPLYLALPLSQLDTILSSKVIPYHDNVTVLQSLQAADWTEIQENLKTNHVLHESCHAVSRSVVNEFKIKKCVLSLLLEESFANTCELFGLLFAEEQVHRIFYAHNSYTVLFEVRSALKKVCNEIGSANAFRFFFFGYLHSNYLFNAYSDRDFKQLQDLIGSDFTQDQVRNIRSLLKLCFTLDMNFRVVTTGLYMRINSKNMDGQLENFGYFSEFCQHKPYKDYLERLIEIALKGVP